MHRELEVPEARVPVVECLDGPARITLKEPCNNSFCERWHPPECLFYKTKSGCRFGKSALMRIARLMNSPAKGPKRMVTKVQWLCWRKNEHHHRTGRPVKNAYSSSYSEWNVDKIRCVKFTKAVVRHADIRDQNPSLGMICQGEPHQRNPNAPKFEGRFQEETEWQERCARKASVDAGQKYSKIKGEK